ncbi:MAG: hypothetical protein U1A77_13230 [Pirellulales bacterium]
MSPQFTYGSGRSIALDWQAHAPRVDVAHPRGDALSDPTAATRAALQQPLDFPPLTASLAPGDRVAITVEPGTPCAPAIVQGLLQELENAGIDRSNITLVTVDQASADAATAPERGMPASSVTESTQHSGQQDSPSLADSSSSTTQSHAWRQLGIQHVIHRRDDATQLAYLAASDAADPIYLNRALLDADIVIPIGVHRLRDSLGYLGVAGSVYPTFSDLSAFARLRPTDSVYCEQEGKQLRDEASRALWLLGVQFVIQVVPGNGDSCIEILAGQIDAVAREARRCCENVWRAVVTDRVSLAIVGIAGPESDETWDDVARALATVERVATDEAVIVVCVEAARGPRPVPRPAPADAASSPPPRSTSKRSTSKSSTSKSSTKRRTRRTKEYPTLIASLVERLGESHRLYIVSELASDICEEMGLTRIESDADLARLMRGHSQGVLVVGGQFAGFRVEGEETP